MTQVKAKSDELQKVLQEVGTKVYQQAAAEAAKQQGQQTGPQPGTGPETPPGEEQQGENGESVVDSEVEKFTHFIFLFFLF